MTGVQTCALPIWNEFSDADHDTLTDAFTRLTVASYAHNFDGFGGEHFEEALDQRMVVKR